MSKINLNNSTNSIASTQVPTVPVSYSYNTTPPTIINHNNSYLPTYLPNYYTSNYGYQMPYQWTGQYYNNTTQKPVTPSATIQAGGTTCNVPQGTNGLNIIINSPTVATPGSNPMINSNTNYLGGNGQNSTNGVKPSSNDKKKKKIVALTDNYIKNLENYLRSPNKESKITAIKEIAQRFTEDDSRKTNKSLNALLNLALQAKEKEVRLLALTLLTTGAAGGNEITVQILNNLQQSDIYKGGEANDAKKALLKMSETVVSVPDNSPAKGNTSKGGE